MKKEFSGFGKIFSFTFLHHVKSKGYIASTLIIAMLCLLIPVGVLAGRELIRGGEPEPEQGMEQEMESAMEQGTESTMELEAGEETDLERELEKLQYLYVVDRSQDGLDELAGFGDYLRQETGLDFQVIDFGNDMEKAAELSSGKRDVMVLTADQAGKDFEINLLVPEGGISEMAAQSLVPLLDEYMEGAKSRINGTSGEEGNVTDSEEADSGDKNGVEELQLQAAEEAGTDTLFFARAAVLGHQGGGGVADVLLGHIGKVIDAACGGKGCHGVDTHGVHDGLNGDLAQLNGGLLHGAGPAVLDGAAQQRAVKDEPAPPQLKDGNFELDIDDAEHTAERLAEDGGEGAAFAAPAQHLDKEEVAADVQHRAYHQKV